MTPEEHGKMALYCAAKAMSELADSLLDADGGHVESAEAWLELAKRHGEEAQRVTTVIEFKGDAYSEPAMQQEKAPEEHHLSVERVPADHMLRLSCICGETHDVGISSVGTAEARWVAAHFGKSQRKRVHVWLDAQAVYARFAAVEEWPQGEVWRLMSAAVGADV